MKIKPIYICFFSLFFIVNYSQNKQEAVIKKSSYEPNFTVGFDILNAGIAAFSDRKLFQGFVSSNIKNNWYVIGEVGFEKNIYDKNGYDAMVNGAFARLGSYYMLAFDRENPHNGFFAGAKVAGALYEQEYRAVPIRGFANNEISQTFPSSSQSSYWMEANVGGRVQLFESAFYIEVTAQPKYLVYTTKQEDIFPMIVPGFGKSFAKFNMGFSWNIAYAF